MQFGYIFHLIELLARGEAKTIVPTHAATEAFLAAMREKAPTTVWAQGCTSWYLDATGQVASWPWDFARFEAEMVAPRLEDFALT